MVDLLASLADTTGADGDADPLAQLLGALVEHDFDVPAAIADLSHEH